MCGIKSCLCILRLWFISALNFLNVFHTIYMPLPVILWSMSPLLMMASLFAEWEVQHFPYVKKSGAYVDQTSVGPASDAWKRKWTEPSTRVPDTFKHLQIVQGPLRQWNRHRWFGQVIPGKNFRATERSKRADDEKDWKSMKKLHLQLCTCRYSEIIGCHVWSWRLTGIPSTRLSSKWSSSWQKLMVESKKLLASKILFSHNLPLFWRLTFPRTPLWIHSSSISTRSPRHTLTSVLCF